MEKRTRNRVLAVTGAVIVTLFFLVSRFSGPKYEVKAEIGKNWITPVLKVTVVGPPHDLTVLLINSKGETQHIKIEKLDMAGGQTTVNFPFFELGGGHDFFNEIANGATYRLMIQTKSGRTIYEDAIHLIEKNNNVEIVNSDKEEEVSERSNSGVTAGRVTSEPVESELTENTADSKTIEH